MGRRVLIITYYWPPLAGSGVQRWLKFAKYLPDFGWEPVIFTPENPDFELIDESLLKDITPDLEVIRFPIWEPYNLFRAFKKGSSKNLSYILETQKKSFLDKIGVFLRANFFIPDPRIFWAKPSSEFLIDCVNKGQFDAIISTGPPHSLHILARNIKRKTGIPWIADFRDPWTQWDFNLELPMLKPIRKIHQKLELSVLREADEIVTISPTFQTELNEISGRIIQLITNGFDEADQVNLSHSNTLLKEKEALEIVYSGIIDALRDPRPFLLAMKNAFANTQKNVNCRFVGKVSKAIIDFVSHDDYLKNHVIFEGYVSHQRVFEFYQNADLLLLVLTTAKNSQGNIPGKVFEYMATGKFTIALGDPEGDTAKILNTANAGQVFLHTDNENLEEFLLNFDPKKIQSKEAFISKYSRKNLTADVARLIDGMVSKANQIKPQK
jgi:hypothetical protein